MSSHQFRIEAIDKEFVEDVLLLLRDKVGADVDNQKLASYLFSRMQSDPEYFYHHDEEYWAEVIYNKFISSALEYTL
ncbi:hypothetical protein [Halobacillus salinus]|uniref:hypothetical protein n=1 Tax=Halobacillus salinus TaxID=192814 RepID=UPI0009A6EAEC|nr:hypothetical protein [Halobacillus salinus]